MQLSLNTASETLISEIMASGAYGNPDEAVMDALAMLHESLLEKQESIDAELQEGIAQIERGETVPYDLSKIKDLASARISKGLAYMRTNSAALPPSAS
jgi:Arc/MetJ-type ribon-helix-helix transcriptional regulator